MPRINRRRYQALLSSGPLLAAAAADGASVVYTFDEASGSIINRVNPGTYDLIHVHAQVQRGVVAPGPPDLKAAGFVQAAQAWESYGYARSFPAGRPAQDTYTRVCHEVVVRVDGAQTTKIIIHGQAFGGATDAFALTLDGGGDLRFQLPLSTPIINLSGSAAASQDWHHYLWQYDGTDFQVWVDGVLADDATTGIGAATLYDVAANDCVMNVGGGEEDSIKNCACSVAFWASYPNLSLTTDRIIAHAAAAGV